MFGIAGRKEFYDLKEKDGNPGLGIRPFFVHILKNCKYNCCKYLFATV